MNRAAFFDRDGTINVDTGYLYEPEKLKFIPGVPELIKKYNDEGYLVIVITNQSGIARGMFTVEQMERFNKYMNQRLQNEYGAHIDAIYVCPHLPEITGECDCRKPKPGLFLRAIRDYNIDPAESVAYGDSERDRDAAITAGVRNNYHILAKQDKYCGEI